MWGPSQTQSSSRLFVTLPRGGMLGGSCKEHASPGYIYSARAKYEVLLVCLKDVGAAGGRDFRGA